MTPSRPPRSAYVAWMSVCVAWGTTYLAIRVALETIPPALLAGLRFTVAGLVLALVLLARGFPLPPLRAWPSLALMGTLMLGVGNGFVVWAEQWVPSGFAAVIIAMSPFWMTGVEALLPDGERLATRTVAGMLVGFAGVVLLVGPELSVKSGPGRQFVFGVIALQLAEIGWTLGSLYSKRFSHRADPVAASAVQMLCAGLVMLVVGTVAGEWAALSFTHRTLAAELYLIVVGSFAGYTAYIYALKHLSISIVSLYAYVNPVIAVLLGALILDEPFGARVALASALVLLGVFVVRSSGGRGQ